MPQLALLKSDENISLRAKRNMQRTWSEDIFAWDSQPADIRHRPAISLADCFDFYKTLQNESVDLLLTDPPYGMTRNGWDTKDFRTTLDKQWQQWLRILKPNGVVVVTAASPFDKIMASSRLDLFRYEWIWNKNKATGHLNANKMPMKAHENILVFYKSPPNYEPQKTLGHSPSNAVYPAEMAKPENLRNYGHHNTAGNIGGATERQPRTVLNIAVINNDNPNKWHPTQKPVKLMEVLIRTYTKKDSLVVDPFLGSGTTAIAAMKCGRKFAGCEINEEYYKGVRERVERFYESGEE